jgi:hypothetical protein
VLRAMVASSDRSLHAGPHCEYCHAFIPCPLQREIAKQAGNGAIAVRVESMIPFDDDTEAAEGYALYQQIRIVATRMRAALTARAAERPIPLGNGRFFGRVEKQGDREYDGATVHAVISATPGLGRDVADQAVEMVATQTKFEAVVKPLVKRGKFAETKRAVFGEVERLGKMERKPTTAIEEYESGPRLVTADKPKQLTEVSEESLPF